MNFIAQLRDKKILSATNTTFTAMRNYVHKNQGDHGNCLLLDNLSQKFFDGEYIYNFILTGYDRKTATVAIAERSLSETKEFNIFSPKVISTVFPVHIEPKLSELKRRVIIIETVKVNNPGAQDISLNNLKDCFKGFWRRITRSKFLETRNKISETISRNYQDFPFQFTHLCLDLMTTAYITNIFDTLDDLLTYFSVYREYLEQHKNLLNAHGENFLKRLG